MSSSIQLLNALKAQAIRASTSTLVPPSRTGITVYRAARELSTTRACHSTRSRARSSLDTGPDLSQNGRTGRGLRGMSLWFKTILVGGGSLTVYGGYVLYKSLTVWPPEVRGDLRDALAAKFKGDLELSERHFHRAYDTILTLPISSLGPDPYLKLSGIAASLADVLEVNNKPQPAFTVLNDTINLLERDELKDHVLTGKERMRVAGIASKLGELANVLEKGEKEEEKWLVKAVEEILRVVKAEGQGQGTGQAAGKEGKMDLPMIVLPGWMGTKDVGAPLEILGEFYERTGRPEYAMPLYLQAISLLIPPAPKKSSPQDRCRGAQLMSHLSSLIMSGPPDPERLHQAEAWAAQALAVVKSSQKDLSGSQWVGKGKGGSAEMCEEVYAAALFNLGVFKEMRSENAVARELFKEAYEQAKKVGSAEGVVQAAEGLRRLDLAVTQSSKA